MVKSKYPIIIISGGTGVGTSTLSLELAKSINIAQITGTDQIREVIRGIISPSINPAMEKSTYESGKTINYSKKTDEIKKTEILRGYKNQCYPINICIDKIVGRAIVENIPSIIEGVHIIPGKIAESEIYKQNKERIIEYHITISDKKIHKSHFKNRQKEAPERNIKKYLKNFQEIRWIHNYLHERATRFDYIHIVNNIGTLQEAKENIIKHYYKA